MHSLWYLRRECELCIIPESLQLEWLKDQGFDVVEYRDGDSR